MKQKVLDLLKRTLVKALEHPKTTALGLSAIVGGVVMIKEGKFEEGFIATLTGLGLVFAGDSK